MSIKLYNRSKIPEEVIRPVLMAAKSLAKCKGSNVVVRVGNGTRGSGCALDYVRVSLPWLQGKRRSANERMIKANGCITLQFTINAGFDPIESARRFFRTAIHEFHHVREFQNGDFHRKGNSFSEAERTGKRKSRWAVRPEEIRAVNAVDDAMGKLERDRRRRERLEGLLLDLAVAIEENTRCGSMLYRRDKGRPR